MNSGAHASQQASRGLLPASHLGCWSFGSERILSRVRTARAVPLQTPCPRPGALLAAGCGPLQVFGSGLCSPSPCDWSLWGLRLTG